jgi:hypothetical protein
MDAVLQLSQTQRVQLFERTAQLTGSALSLISKVCQTALVVRKNNFGIKPNPLEMLVVS